jgi:hypothetical protein
VSTARVDFTRGAAERIARTVRLVEQGERDQSGPRFGRVVEDSPRKVFRVCTYTGSWTIDTVQTITFRNVTTTPNTLKAYNLFADLDLPNPSPGVCAVGKDGTAWYLIAARCP